VRPGPYARVTRGLAFAPYADLLWLETATPSLAEARAFADIIYSQYPHQLLAYSCSPSFNWPAHLDDARIAKFHKELAAMGYRFQFIASPGLPAARHQRETGTGYLDPDTQATVPGAEKAPLPSPYAQRRALLDGFGLAADHPARRPSSLAEPAP
jgi:isocitrate lyase